jgi:hypothetical protein
MESQNRNAGRNQSLGDCSIQGISFGQMNSSGRSDFEPSLEQFSSGLEDCRAGADVHSKAGAPGSLTNRERLGRNSLKGVLVVTLAPVRNSHVRGP